MFLSVVLLQEQLSSEHLLAMVALYNVAVFGLLDQVLIASEGLLFSFIFFSKLAQERVDLLNLVSLLPRLLVQVLVLHVEGTSQALEVVLAVY